MNTSAISESVFKAIEQQDFDGALSLLSSDFVFKGATPVPLTAIQWINTHRALAKAMPDLKVNYQLSSNGGNVVSAAVQLMGTHTGELDLHLPDVPKIPATGKRIALPREKLEVDVNDGKVTAVQVETLPDGGVPGILKQMGLGASPKAGFERHASRENSMWYRGDLFTFLVESKDTNGAFSTIEFTPKRGLEPPPHIHTHEDEVLYVISGNVTFNIGGEEIAATPGSYVFMPRNVRHSWRIQTPEAHLLMNFAPAGLEEFFKQLALPVVGDDLHNAPQTIPDMQKMLSLANQYGLIFGPPKK